MNMNQKKTAYIISLKFAPGLKKEFLILGENIKSKGINIKYIISEKYSELERSCDDTEYISTRDDIKGILKDTLNFINGKRFMRIFFTLLPPDFVCFYNPHPLNPFVARLIKNSFPKAITVVYLHDPYKPDKSLYGVKKATYIKLVELVQRLTVKYMDYVISPSEYSSYLFRKYYPKFKGKNYIAPLLVPDTRSAINSERRFFSIVGTAHLATGHDTFIELVNYVAKKKLDYKFALISSSNISLFLKKLTDEAKKIIKVINKSLITDSEIDVVIRQSYAVFRLDREVTQSGVIPVAYMNETPVIVRDIAGLKQHVKHKENGYLVPFNSTPEVLIQAMDFVKKNFDELSRNARRSYEETWAEWNFDKYYEWLINLLKTDKSIL